MSKAFIALCLVVFVNVAGGIWSLICPSPYFGWAMFRTSTQATLRVTRLIPNHDPISINPGDYNSVWSSVWRDPYRKPAELHPVVVAFVKFLNAEDPGHYRAELSASQNLRPVASWTYEQ